MVPPTAPAAARRPGRHSLGFRAGTLIVFCMLGFPSSLRAAAGDLDVSFGFFGKVLFSQTFARIPIGLGLQENGKILAAATSRGTGRTDFVLGRFAVNGAPDPSFGDAGLVTTDFRLTPFVDSLDNAGALAVQQDQRIVVGGTSNAINFLALDFALARYNTDGTADTTFGFNGRILVSFAGIGSEDELRDLLIQPDDRILAAGFSDLGLRNVSDFAVARLNADGFPDASFGQAGRVSTDVSGAGSLDRGNALALQEDGRILLAGTSNNDFALVRYNPDGSLDTGFGSGGKKVIDVTGMGSADTGSDVAVQPDGRIVMVGYSFAATPSSSRWDFTILRFNTDGTLDNSFGSGGRVVFDFTGSNGDDKAFAVAIQEDGKILVGGQDLRGDFALARLNPDGTLDGSFGLGGKVVTAFGSGTIDQIMRMVLQPDRKILVGGTTSSRVAITRYLNDPAPEELLEELIVFTEGLAILKGIETSLLSKLNHALEVLDPEEPGATCRFLRAFANQSSALEGKMQLSEGAADELLRRVGAIEDALACSG